MKLNDIVKAIAKLLGTSDVQEINKLLKAEKAPKFRITGKALGHFGFTGHIKSVSDEGVKAFMANKVSLIRLIDIETFEKAKPREERPVRTAKPETKAPAASAPPKKAKPAMKAKAELEDDTDFDDDEGDFEDLRPKKQKASKAKSSGKSGSKFIPTSKK
ncbi:hypothetical protein B9G69_001940 [Bdellovibrio sp. SKB1291214]|uniref:hypothetical protein n=1 Tax=Bdellovibrio sp. SKB1291214 TaxID=1732569 RepID=UPI000B519BF1|nr:hypothetical protein [Bdellovibrio sp. SKB1291214]UYL09332.1 hypothetical protein B9G69_001940 [Bdellovibrio sp. SKB1291214]